MKFTNRIIHPLATLMILLLVHCGLATSCTAPTHPESPQAVSHALLFYLAGDNNLGDEVYEKLAEIEQIAVPAGKRLLVYTDTRTETPCLYELGANPKRKGLQLLQQYEEQNSADAESFGAVLKTMRQRYPGATYGLVLFSHASGWMPQGSYNKLQTRSVVTDGGQEMEIAHLARAIPQGMFEYVVFEACHMAGIEVAYELRDRTKCVVASSAEVVSPGFTAVYRQAGVALLMGNPTLFAAQAYQWYENQVGYMQSATLSVIKTAHLEELARYIRGHAHWEKPVNLAEVQCFDRRSQQLFFDFEAYYTRLLDTPLEQLELKKLLERCVVWRATTPYFMLGYQGFGVAKHSGLTTYVRQEGYPNLNLSYRETGWYKATGCKE